MGKFSLFDTFFIITLISATSTSTSVDEIGHGSWSGVGAFIAVDAERVQTKLDEYAASSTTAPQLYVPSVPVFKKLLPGQHVVFMDFGTVSSRDFDKTSGFSVSGSESTFLIPFLADSVDGRPLHNLALGQLYQKDRGDFPQSNLLQPYLAVEEITVCDCSATLRDLGEELAVKYQVTNPCIKPSPPISDEFTDLYMAESIFVSPEPDLTFCDRHPDISSSTDYCCIMRDIREEVEKSLPNVCTVYTSSDEEVCEASLQVVNMTSGFRELLLLGEGPIKIMSSAKYYGNSTVGLRYPCI